MARSLLLTGAQVLCYINNTRFGRVANLSYKNETPRKRYQGIDQLTTSELIPLGFTTSGSMGIYRLHQGGGIEAAGMAATWQELTREKYFSILIIDRVSDTPIYQAQQCLTNSQQWSVGKGHVMGNISFMGIVSNNETEPGRD